MPEITSRLSTALADRYRIERRLGEGGMETVYLVGHRKHQSWEVLMKSHTVRVCRRSLRDLSASLKSSIEIGRPVLGEDPTR